MIKNTGKYFFVNAKIFFRVYLFCLLLLPFLFLAQIIQEQNAGIFISEGAILHKQNPTIAKIKESIIYISDDATIFSLENITNAQIIKISKKLDKKSAQNRKESITKKISKKTSKKQKYFAGLVKKVKIFPATENKNSIYFFTSTGMGITVTVSSFPNFIINNFEDKTNLNNFKNKDPEVFYQNFTFSDTFHFHLFVRPPPII